MVRLTRCWWIFLGAAFGTYLATPTALACDCGFPEFPEALAQSDAVFSGVALEQTPIGSSGFSVRFRQDAVWKGPVLATASIFTEGLCAFDFEVGERYVVYAIGNRGTPPMCELSDLFLETGICSRTARYDPEEAALLGEPIWTPLGGAFRRGDFNDDGTVDLSDPVGILNSLFLAAAPASCEDVSDVNDDGAVDLSDAVFALNFLFLGGPPPPAPGSDVPGFDSTTDDPFPCGDIALACPSRSQSTLPGVRIEIVRAPCTLTLDEAAAGVSFEYRIVSEESLVGVTSNALGTCQPVGPQGIYTLGEISGDDGRQRYCLCDLGKCFFQSRVVDLEAGGDPGILRWCGRNWFGPSDFNNPVGPPFPPGRYTLELRSAGEYVAADGGEVPFEMTASYEFELTP